MNKHMRVSGWMTLVCLLLQPELPAQTQIPQILGPGVNSACAEINPVLSNDGKTLYFTRVNYPDSASTRPKKEDIWYSQLDEEGKWGVARRLPDAVNLGQYNALLSSLPDGHTFLISGIYNKKGTRWINRGFSFIRSLDDGTWGKPVALKIRSYKRKDKGSLFNAWLTPDSAILFLSYSVRRDGRKIQLHVAERKRPDLYGKPHRLKGGPNSGQDCEAPFLSMTGDTLYFSGLFGRKGDKNMDILMSIRTDSTYLNWTKPVSVNDSVNSPAWESYYRIDPAGRWVYFCSDRQEGGHSDIYRIARMPHDALDEKSEPPNRPK